MEMQSLLMPPPPQYLEAFRAIHEALAPAGPIDALVSLAVIAVLPGLCEELVVRGVLLPGLAARMPPVAAVLVVGVALRGHARATSTASCSRSRSASCSASCASGPAPCGRP